MRRMMWIGALLLAILVGVVVGATSYHAGVTHGLEQAGHASQVVHVVGPGYGYGYFPFGFLLFPLFLFGIFFLVRGAFWRRRWDGDHEHPHWGPGGGGYGRPEEWHRRQHEQSSGDHPSAGGEPSHV